MPHDLIVTQPPGGEPPPRWGIGPGGDVDLHPLAVEVCRRYRLMFPDEQARYGAAGPAWCVHDNLYLLFWACEDVAGLVPLTTEVDWLARVLAARNFPLERLAAGLDLGADVVRERLEPDVAVPLSAVLAAAAHHVRSHGANLR